jgi:ribosome-associated protein
VQEKVKAQGGKVYGVEGEQVGEWVLVDLGAVIVHIMQPAVRQHYNLEELWTPPKATRKRARAETTPG